MTADTKQTDRSRVSILCGATEYDTPPPYCPAKGYPEYPFGESARGECPNGVYQAVRESWRLLGFDSAHFGSAKWNPLGDLIRPGQTVVLKPNLVRDFRESSSDHDNCLITHGSVIRAVADYVYIALQGRGRIVIADASHSDADFDAIRKIVSLDELQTFYRRQAGFDLEVYDLRPERADKVDGVIVGHKPMPGDPAGYTKVDLGEHSAFVEIEHLCHLLYGSEYDTSEIRGHHRGGVHEYLISRTVLDADIVVSLPKLKTHKKVGLTVNLKNLVGINGNKNWLPHYREGTPARGGDQFADDCIAHRLERSTMAQFRRLFPLLGPVRRLVAGPVKAVGKRIFGDTDRGTIRSGNWHGNDTAWRMVLDLNRILLYADSDGGLHNHPVRRFLSVVDGIVAGEGNGPLDPTPRAAGVLLAGMNPVAVDMACARLMGFDFRRIPSLARAFADHPYPIVSSAPDEIACVSDHSGWNGRLPQIVPCAPPFEPHFGWRGAVELAEDLCLTVGSD